MVNGFDGIFEDAAVTSLRFTQCRFCVLAVRNVLNQTLQGFKQVFGAGYAGTAFPYLANLSIRAHDAIFQIEATTLRQPEHSVARIWSNYSE